MSDLKIALVETLSNNTIVLVKLSDDRVFKLPITVLIDEADADAVPQSPTETQSEIWSAVKRLLIRLRVAAAELIGRIRA